MKYLDAETEKNNIILNIPYNIYFIYAFKLKFTHELCKRKKSMKKTNCWIKKEGKKNPTFYFLLLFKKEGKTMRKQDCPFEIID